MKNFIAWLRDLDANKIKAEMFGELRNVILKENEKDTMVREYKLEEMRTLLNHILHGKDNFIGYIPRRDCLLDDVIEGQMTIVNGIGITAP